MKLMIILLLLSLNCFANPIARFGGISKTVTTAGTPERASATALLVRQACFQCSGANTGTTCFVGATSALTLAATGIVLVKPTATIPDALVCFGDLSNGSGPRLDLNSFWVNVATNGDEVNVFYIE